MFNKTRCAVSALAFQGVFTLGALLFLSLDLELLMFVCGIAAVALTDLEVFMPRKGGES